MSDAKSDVDNASVDNASVATSPSKSDEKQPAAKLKLRDRFAGLMWLGRTVTHATVLLAVFVGGIALVGVAQRQGWIRSGGEVSATGDGASPTETVYTCSMHPQIRQDEPGDCPICGMPLVHAASGGKSVADQSGRYICPMMCTPPSSAPGRCPVCAMELVPALSGGGPGDGISIKIEPAARRLIGIQTAVAKVGQVAQTIRTIGSIDYDESKLATISAYVPGRIEKMFADYVGVPVQTGDDLALVYSPDLYSAQVEYLTSIQGNGLKRLGGSSSNFGTLAKEKLIQLGMTDGQIAELRSRGEAESRVRIESPIAGTVIEKYAVEGDYVNTGSKLYRIADLSTVWLMMDLYPDDAARIRFGQEVEAEVDSLPGEVFTGRVAFIDPTVDAKTRTVSVRVEMLNPDARLKPGDNATARVFAPAVPRDQIYDPALAGKYISPMHPQIIRDRPGDCPICGMDLIPTSKLGYADAPVAETEVVTVPRSAVLMTGDNAVIYVETEPGRFEVRRVTVGPMTDDRAVVLQGIQEGEIVATNGNFLIDSQMQLAGNPSLLDPSRAPSSAPGPLKLPETEPTVLAGQAAREIDRAYAAYFEIQQALAADQVPAAEPIQTLRQSLATLTADQQVPAGAKERFQIADDSLAMIGNTLDESREAFKTLSHAMLRASTMARGPVTAAQLFHLYCPMVPGGGGDWMQADAQLVNPYWGSEMLTCGEVVEDLAIVSDAMSSLPETETR